MLTRQPGDVCIRVQYGKSSEVIFVENISAIGLRDHPDQMVIMMYSYHDPPGLRSDDPGDRRDRYQLMNALNHEIRGKQSSRSEKNK